MFYQKKYKIIIFLFMFYFLNNNLEGLSNDDNLDNLILNNSIDNLNDLELFKNFKKNLNTYSLKNINFSKNNSIINLYVKIYNIEKIDKLNNPFSKSIIDDFLENNKIKNISNIFFSEEKKILFDNINNLFNAYRKLQNKIFDEKEKTLYINKFIYSFNNEKILKELEAIYNNLIQKRKLNKYLNSIKYSGITSIITFSFYKLFNYLFENNLANTTEKIKNNIKFKDFGGYKLIKEEISKIINLLKNYKIYNNILKIPKGAIFYGPPGTGKTYFAKAIAGEFGINFLNISASELISKWYGETQKNVSALFKKAKSMAPCILYLDEADSVLTRRDRGMNNSDNHSTQEFLKELDGINELNGVFVILSTNLFESIDPALLRSGRIEEHFYIGLPLYKERIDIINKILLKYKLNPDKNVSVEYMANRFDGKSPADIDSFFNKLLINNISNKKINISNFSLSEFDEMYKDKFYGLINDFEYKESDLVSTAYHEAGHAFIMLKDKNYPYLFDSLTIVSRGEYLGVAMATQSAEKVSYIYDEILSLVDTSLAGRISEEIILKKKFSGATSDLDKAKELLKRAFNDGMGKKIVYKDEEEMNSDISELINERYEIVKKIIENNKEKLKEIVRLLLTKKTLFKSDLIKVINEK